MTHLLDTDVIINLIHAHPPAPFPDDASLAISVITLAELRYGIERSDNSPRMKAWLDGFLTDHAIRIIPVDQQTVELFVDTKITLEKQGERLADFDLFIAATAMEHHLTLITANKKHFQRIKGLLLA